MIGTMHDAGDIQAEGILKFLNDIRDCDALADIVTYSFVEDVVRKQEILETLNLRQRLQKVIVVHCESNRRDRSWDRSSLGSRRTFGR